MADITGPTTEARIDTQETRRRFTGPLVVAFALLISLLGFATPARAASYTVKFSGVVVCNSGSWGVQGIWVDNLNGTDAWASWWPFPGKANAAYYSVSVTASRVDPAIRLDVGCGGTKSAWKKTLRTPDFRTKTGYTENRICDVAAANGSRSCKPAPKGPTQATNGGIAGYCTWGAYEQWKKFVGTYPSIGGNAKQMDDNAAAKGFYVSTVPHPKSMVVFNTSDKYGHVGWVTKVYRSNGKVYFDYIDMNGGSCDANCVARDYQTTMFGKYATKTGKAWDTSIQRFIVAPT